jgi:diguanylate cyclase (GGDEF)-like protein
VNREIDRLRTAVHAAEASLEQERALLRGALDAVAGAAAACDARGVLTVANSAACELMGGEAGPSAPDLRPLVQALEQGDVRDVEVSAHGPGGERRTLLATGRAMLGAEGNVVGAVVALRGATEERGSASLPAEHASHDPLTGLASRGLLQDHVRRALSRAGRNGWSTAMLAIDIDDFRRVNDTLGHDAGDELLVTVARRLEATLRAYDTVARPFTVARLGGDEFFVLCEDVRGEWAAAAVAGRLAEAIAAPVELAGEATAVTASVGLVLRRGAGDDEALVLDAEAAMRRAKERGHGRQEFFSEGMRVAIRELAETRTALGRALEDGQLWLAYQPKLALATGRIAGVEALLRWDHPERGTMPPLEFIGLAEDTGLIVPIGAWVLGEACRQVARWTASFADRVPLTVSVNVSGRQFDADVVAVVARALADTGTDPRLLCLEVTESTVMTDVGAAAATLRDLKALGVTVSIDDFGTGYSSLAYLRRLPLDELKVDKSFVDGLGRDPEDTAIVAAVVGMAHALTLAVCAEGVETTEQLAALHTLGCEYAQGYYFARPQQPDAIAELLVAEGEASWDGHLSERRDPAARARGAFRSERVLVADDAPDVLQLARLSLAPAGFDVHEAGTGEAAMTLAEEIRPDCVILDVSMPDMNGFEVCRALRSSAFSSECTIVMLTATASPAGKVEAFSAGADDYIVKPFAPRDLVGRVRAAMNRRRDAAD